ncbi:MAG: MMPL family transporter [Thermodesulfobacteriota bacterium]|nr:MMPL family transporter [Thermodesulfobacteriota bacterium]
MKRFIEGLASFVIRWRIAVIIIMLAVTIFLMYHIKYFRLVNDPDTFSPPDHPNMIFNTWAEKNFGMGNVAIIGIQLKEGGKFKSVRNADTLGKLWKLVRAYEELPHVWKGNIMSLATKKIRHVVGEDGWLKVTRMMKDPDDFPIDQWRVDHIKEGVDASRLYHDFMMSMDEQMLLIVLDFRDSVKDDYFEVWQEMHRLGNEIVEDENHHVLYGGEVPICSWMIEQLRARAWLLIPAFAIILIILWIDLKSFVGALAPFIGNSVSFFWTMGFMGLTGYPLTCIAPAILLLILAVGHSHSMQLAKRYFELVGEGNNSQEAGKKAIEQLAPASLTSIFTDTIGFALLSLFPVMIYKEYSIFGTFGMISFIPLCYILVPVCLATFISEENARKIGQKESEHGFFDTFAEFFSKFLLGKGKWVMIGAAAAVVVVSAAFIPYTIVGCSLTDAGIKPGSELSVMDDEIQKVIGTNPFSFAIVNRDYRKYLEYEEKYKEGEIPEEYLELKKKARDTLKDPAMLKALVEFEEWYRDLPYGSYIISIADFLQNLHFHIWEMEEDKYIIPDSRGEVADLLFAYRSGGDPSDFDTVVSLHYEQGLAIGFYGTTDPRELRKFRKKFEAKLHELFDPFKDKVDVMYMGSFMGTMFSLYDVTDKHRWDFWLPFVVAVFLAMMIILRSFTASFMIVIALGVCIVFQYGLMGFYSLFDNPLIKWGGNLTFYTMMMFGMVVGIGVDYSIYMTQRLRREFTNTGDLQETLRRCYAGTGAATFVTFITMCLVLVPLMFTPLTPLYSTAAILIPDFIVAFLMAEFLVPALYVAFRPKAMVLRGAQEKEAKGAT